MGIIDASSTGAYIGFRYAYSKGYGCFVVLTYEGIRIYGIMDGTWMSY